MNRPVGHTIYLGVALNGTGILGGRKFWRWSGEPYAAGMKCGVTGIIFRAYSYYNRTGGNDDDERPIDGHTAAHPTAASELCINGYVTCGRKITWGPGLRACKVPNFGEGMALLPPGVPHARNHWR